MIKFRPTTVEKTSLALSQIFEPIRADLEKVDREFGRHVAVFYPGEHFDALKARLAERGAEIVAPLRATTFDRFFFREPVNGYLFEVIDQARAPLPNHLDQ